MTTPITRPKKTRPSKTKTRKTIKVEGMEKETKELIDTVANTKLKTVLDWIEKKEVKDRVKQNPDITIGDVLIDAFLDRLLLMMTPEQQTKLKQMREKEKAI